MIKLIMFHQIERSSTGNQLMHDFDSSLRNIKTSNSQLTDSHISPYSGWQITMIIFQR